MSSDRFVALYAFPIGPSYGLKGFHARTRYARFIGDTAPDRCPIRPLWLECLSFEDWQGKVSPRTRELCRRQSIDILFRVHVQSNPRGKLLLETLEKIHASTTRSVASDAPR